MSDPGTSDAHRCPQCGAEFVPATSPLGLCPACLLKLGASDPAWRPLATEPVLTVLPVPPHASSSTVRRRWRRSGAFWMIAVAALVAVLAAVILVRRPNDRILPLAAIVRFSLPLPDGSDSLEGAQFAVSPDGTRIVVAARGIDGRQRLWVRPLQSLEWHELARTEGAALPFWSPDSRAVGFFAERKLKRIDISNGLTHTLCDAPSGRGGTWGKQKVIVFAAGATGPLSVVHESGGTPQPATSLDQARGETAHMWPHFLDGQRFLFVASATAKTQGASVAGLYAGSLNSDRQLIVPGGGPGAFAQGFLLFVRGTALVAQRFDPIRAELADDVQMISQGEQTGGSSVTGFAFSVSDSGVLVHQSGDARPSQLTWFDRSGRAFATMGEPSDYQHFSLSPDGRRVALSRRDVRDAASHLWLIDADRHVMSRLTMGPSQNGSPLWAPDGLRIAFVSRRDGGEGLYVTDASGGGKEEALHRSPESSRPTDWSPDGRVLLYSTESTNTGSDLWILPLGGERKPQAFLQTPFNESDGHFSPDGRWVAYVSDESGRDEVHVRTFPQPDGRWQISAGGGSLPRWRGDGRELFFVSDGQLLAVDVQTGPTLRVGAPRVLFTMRQADHYEVSGDGQRFLVKMLMRERDKGGLQVVLNWTAELLNR